jgi:hypothetical protein
MSTATTITEIIVSPQNVDNITLNPGVGGETLRSRNIDGLHYQVIMLATAESGRALDVSITNPLPISGEVTVNSSTPVDTSSLLTDGTTTVGVDPDNRALSVVSTSIEDLLERILKELETQTFMMNEAFDVGSNKSISEELEI